MGVEGGKGREGGGGGRKREGRKHITKKEAD